jgi:hypothetical protein
LLLLIVTVTLLYFFFFQNMRCRRLLPLLRPMGFEKDDVVCEQGEDAAEMYVVVSGTLMGETKMDTPKQSFQRLSSNSKIQFPTRLRHISVGGSVNTLHALGVWPQCLETVTAQQETETYALSEPDMRSLFMGSDTDKKLFEEIRHIELARFRFDKEATAPTGFGRPLYFSCFSTVQLALVSVRGAFRGTSPRTAAKRAMVEPLAVKEEASALAAEAAAAADEEATKLAADKQGAVGGAGGSSSNNNNNDKILKRQMSSKESSLAGRECW